MTDDVHTELITGDALLAGADDLQGRLGALLATGRPIRLDLSGVTAADVSFVQSLVLTGFSPKLRVTFEKAGVPVDPTAGRITLN